MVDNDTVFVNHYLRSLMDHPNLSFLLDYFIVPSSHFRVWNRIALLAKGYQWKDCDEFEDCGCDLDTNRIFLQKYDLNHISVDSIDKSTGRFVPTYSLRNKPVNEYLVISTFHDWLGDTDNSNRNSIAGEENGPIYYNDCGQEVAVDCDSDDMDIDRNRSLSIEYTVHSNTINILPSRQQQSQSQSRPSSSHSTTSTTSTMSTNSNTSIMRAQRSQSGIPAGSIDNLMVAAHTTNARSVVLRPEPIHSGTRKTYMTNTVSGMHVVARDENRPGDHNSSITYSILNAGNQRRKQGLGGD